MAYPINETFTTSLPAGFASSGTSATVSAKYSSTYAAVDVSTATGIDGVWRLDIADYATTYSCTFDLQLISDAGGGRTFGLLLIDSSLSALSVASGNNLAGSGATTLSFMAGLGDTIALTTLINGSPLYLFPTPVINGRFTYRVESGKRLDGRYQTSFYYNDLLVHTMTERTPTARKPALYLNGCKWRVHSVVGTATSSDPLLSMPSHTNGFTPTYRYITDWQNGSPLAPKATGVISGIVTIQGTIAARKVRLFNKSTGQLVGQVMSGVDGSYTFTNLDPTFEYFAVGHDYTRAYNAVIQDMIQP